ncbi:MAG TPA: hypothetical protein PLJ97_02910 [Candidatus Saccharibacteria bacterium]|jgi:protein-S-isoprenylcysteine O-methyltransferase Ste14|nr:hypothetical protein [Candidatus Saccharibacteria bacterium]
MNETPSNLSKAGIASIAALVLLGVIGGWYILVSGGFYHQHGRFSNEYTYVGGSIALVMVVIEFVMAGIGAAAIVQYSGVAKYWYAVACGSVLVPPLLFVLVRHFS